MHKLSVLMAQLNPKVGAMKSNASAIIEIILEHQHDHDLIIFPELAVSGYPPEDLLLRDDFYQAVQAALDSIIKTVRHCHVIVGHPQRVKHQHFNAASILSEGKTLAVYHKQHIPNYGIFDEKRYFSAGEAKPCTFSVNDYKIGLCICEDMWQPGPVEQLIETGANVAVCINASPFDYNKYDHREALLKHYTRQGLAIIYVNQVGGQDELLFDGQSFAIDDQGTVCARAPAFIETTQSITLQNRQVQGHVTPLQAPYELLYNALVCGTRDYVLKNNFPGVLLGLSGGIDSALTLAIATEAVGADRVHAVMMPSRYTAEMGKTDALRQLQTLNVSHSNLSIEPAFNSLLATLAPEFKDLPVDTTEENIQARIRGILLMALSNKTGKMVLTTSNKSETAVGYATLYGDMAGGFAVLKDVLKTQVYELARYVNREEEIIPERVITRAPSAELAENQRDQDSLPDYAILDDIIRGFVELNLSEEDIISRGHEPNTVRRVIKMIIRNEYKRRQSAPGIKISPRAFGKDWRFPITSGAFVE